MQPTMMISKTWHSLSATQLALADVGSHVHIRGFARHRGTVQAKDGNCNVTQVSTLLHNALRTASAGNARFCSAAYCNITQN